MKNEVLKANFYSALPPAVKRETDSLLLTHGGSIGELHLKLGRASSVLIGGERLPLQASVSREEIESCFSYLTGGSLYAYRESISKGYVSISDGVRVGIVGEARYEDGKIVGVSGITGLCFRIPGGESSFRKELCEAFGQAKSGLLIYSPPGCGKTTALRTLAGTLGTGRRAVKLAVIDERLEFIPEDYLEARVDILQGYRKSDGLEIALRTLSPDAIMLDEIGSESEAVAMLPYVNSGVKIVATAHAGSYGELFMKKNLEAFFALHVFDVFVGLHRSGGEFFCEVRRVNA